MPDDAYFAADDAGISFSYQLPEITGLSGFRVWRGLGLGFRVESCSGMVLRVQGLVIREDAGISFSYHLPEITGMSGYS